MSDSDLTPLGRWIAAMPKAELHLHIDGSLMPQRLLSLAAKHGVELPYRSEAEIAAAYGALHYPDFLGPIAAEADRQGVLEVRPGAGRVGAQRAHDHDVAVEIERHRPGPLETHAAGHRRRDAVPARTAGAPDAVNIIFRIPWQGVVDHMAHAFDMNAAPRHVGGNQHLDPATLAVIQGTGALVLGHFT